MQASCAALVCSSDGPFLQALEGFAEAKAHSAGPEFRGLSVCALPATDVGEPWLCAASGVASVSVTESPRAVRSLLRASGPAVAANLQRQKVAEAGLRDLGKRVELRLRLRQLMRSPELSADQFRRGCFRLLEHEKVLRNYVEGSILRLNDRNVIRPGQQVIKVAWDFEM